MISASISTTGNKNHLSGIFASIAAISFSIMFFVFIIALINGAWDE